MRVWASVLQGVERNASGAVNRNNFAVDQGFKRELLTCSGNLGKSSSEEIASARPEGYAVFPVSSKAAVTVVAYIGSMKRSFSSGSAYCCLVLIVEIYKRTCQN